jgi:hypothetical protein
MKPAVYGDEETYAFGRALDEGTRIVVEEELIDQSELDESNDPAQPFMAWAYLQGPGGAIFGATLLYRSATSLIEQAEDQLQVLPHGEGCMLSFAGRRVLLMPDSPAAAEAAAPA